MDGSTAFTVLRVAAVTAGTLYLAMQVKKPSRFVGRVFTRLMNSSHSALTDWALSHLSVDKDAKVLDVGCGGGRTIEKLAHSADSVYGIDYAAGSVAGSRAHNRSLIAEGRVHVERASVSQLPFADNFFDIVTAIETQYYWPDLGHDMREVLRVLKPGGRLMIVAESYKGARNDWLVGSVMKAIGSNRLSVEEERTLFQAAGFTSVEVFEELSKGWLCAIGQKPLVNQAR